MKVARGEEELTGARHWLSYGNVEPAGGILPCTFGERLNCKEERAINVSFSLLHVVNHKYLLSLFNGVFNPKVYLYI